MKTFNTIKTGLASLAVAGTLVSGLAMNAYATDYDSSSDHKHGGMSSDENMQMRAGGMKMSGKTPMQGDMQSRMKAMRAKMQAEMQAIVNTDDKAKRQAMFAAHKQKMQGMMNRMQNMHGDCNPSMKGMMNKGKTAVGHQGETD